MMKFCHSIRFYSGSERFESPTSLSFIWCSSNLFCKSVQLVRLVQSYYPLLRYFCESRETRFHKEQNVPLLRFDFCLSHTFLNLWIFIQQAIIHMQSFLHNLLILLGERLRPSQDGSKS